MSKDVVNTDACVGKTGYGVEDARRVQQDVSSGRVELSCVADG